MEENLKHANNLKESSLMVNMQVLYEFQVFSFVFVCLNSKFLSPQFFYLYEQQLTWQVSSLTSSNNGILGSEENFLGATGSIYCLANFAVAFESRWSCSF